MENSKNSEWFVIEPIPIRKLLNQDFYPLSDGNMKKIGGDIHSTLDINPNSDTFGEVHSTLQIPGIKKAHF